MRIAVCVKQVPGAAHVDLDPETGVLQRDGVAAKLNPYDLYAIETAVRLAAVHGAEVTAVSMGPPQAEAALREAFWMGADAGVLLSDRRFGGADVLATAYTLSRGLLAAGGFDLIVCGKQTTDGDTAQVGAELAEFLAIPHVANVQAIGGLADGAITLDCDLPAHVETVTVRLPCLITVDKGIYEPRLPSFKKMLATAKRPVTTLTLDDLGDRDPSHYGLEGSPTRVKRVFPPDRSTTRERWTGDGDDLAARLHALLDERKFLQQLT